MPILTWRAAPSQDASSVLKSAPDAGLRTALLTTCANPGCKSGWLNVWRRRSTPMFEGGWTCSAACSIARLQAAVRRELDDRVIGREIHRHRIPLGLVLLEQGWITQAQLRRAVDAQRSAGAGRLGQWLVRQKVVNEEQITRALGLQWSCPVLPADPLAGEGLTTAMPRLFVDAFGALPLRAAAGRLLYLGFEQSLDPVLALAVERMNGLQVASGMVRESQFRAAHLRMMDARFPAVELVEAASEALAAQVLGKALEKAAPVASRLVRVHDCLWLRMWLGPQHGPLPEIAGVRDVVCSVGASW